MLHEEQSVVEKRTVPRERVRLDKDTVTEEQQVGEEVRKEQIDLDEGGPDVRDDRRPSRSAPATRRDGGQHRRGAVLLRRWWPPPAPGLRRSHECRWPN